MVNGEQTIERAMDEIRFLGSDKGHLYGTSHLPILTMYPNSKEDSFEEISKADGFHKLLL